MDQNVLNLNSIENLLQSARLGRSAGWANELWPVIDSTNNRAQELACMGAPEGVTVFAREQSSGRGRRGNEWMSPPDSGIYMTCILRPPCAPQQLTVYTLAAGIACARAILSATGVEIALKWVNDLMYKGKKLGGILTEAVAIHPSSGTALVIGIGVNIRLNTASMPSEIAQRVEWLDRIASDRVNPNQLAAHILRELEQVCDEIASNKASKILDAWRKHSCTLNQEVTFVFENKSIDGTAVDINDDGALLVRTAGGTIIPLIAGEISIRTP